MHDKDLIALISLLSSQPVTIDTNLLKGIPVLLCVQSKLLPNTLHKLLKAPTQGFQAILLSLKVGQLCDRSSELQINLRFGIALGSKVLCEVFNEFGNLFIVDLIFKLPLFESIN
ncbi:hypothetical protein N7456_007440 [Penicillium angulare]|uniref:Uncharacterized protein n=1 Tax=Penicillium angulare TaxID=116970 RepID=A0A9W9K864_9EURO|nr:hypothetical protein N7456_007440 [Penicillium angulare]